MSGQPSGPIGRRPGRRDTRGEILAVARRGFARSGFAGTSMRTIAAEAGVDPALIHHYFATKQQLFLATIELPLPLDELLPTLAAGGLDGLGPRLIGTILQVWDSDLQAGLVAALRGVLAEPELSRATSEFLTLEVIERLLGGRGLPAAEVQRRSALVAAHILGVVVGRYVMLLPALVAQDSTDLVAAIGPTLQRYLDGEAS